MQKTAVGAAAKKKAPLKAKKNAPNNSMSDDDVSIVSDQDVDMDGSDSDAEFGSSRARPVVQQAKGPQKSASEMYTKVSLLEAGADGVPLNSKFLPALAIGTYLETTGFIHWIG